jgi:hypothetical protein
MKTLALIAFALGFVQAVHASPEEVRLKCDARQLSPGNGGRTGAFYIEAVTRDHVTYGGSWTVNMAWDGDSNPLMGDHIACGDDYPSEYSCYTDRIATDNPSFSIFEMCGRGFRDTSSYEHHPVETRLTLSSNHTHGFFFCKNRKTEVQLEFENCH